MLQKCLSSSPWQYHHGALFSLLSLLCEHTEHITRHQQIRSLLTEITKLHTAPGQRSKTVPRQDSKTRPSFIMVTTQTATSTIK